MKAKRGKLLFKSKAHRPWFGIVILCFMGFFFTSIGLLGFYLNFLNILNTFDVFKLIISALILISGMFFIFWIIRFFLTYVVIYENGVLVRKIEYRKDHILAEKFNPLIPLKRIFIPFDIITNSKSERKTVKNKKGLSKGLFWFIYIYIKNQDPYIISDQWVTEYKETERLILKYKQGIP